MAERVRLFADAGSFLAAAAPLWEPREAELTLLVGLALALERGSLAPAHPPLLALLEDRAPQAALLRNVPRGFVLAALDEAAASCIAHDVSTRPEHADAPNVVGSRPQVRAFVDAWTRALGTTPQLEMAQRILAVDTVASTTLAPGRLRQAETRDLTQVGAWMLAFDREAFGDPVEEHEETIRRTRTEIDAGRVFVWERDGEIVSTASLVHATPRGICVNAVYTPTEQRGRGYATSCVAQLSRRALDEGASRVCLYTDATNPTSNAIYERIGYRFVAESEQWMLRSPDLCRRG